MSDKKTLAELAQGSAAVVEGVSARGELRQRLQDIGLVLGTRVECVQKSPLGDPTAFLIRGAVIALRCEDSGLITIQ